MGIENQLEVQKDNCPISLGLIIFNRQYYHFSDSQLLLFLFFVLVLNVVQDECHAEW